MSDFDRIAGGLHSDPHSVLGAHIVGENLVIRAFRPDAQGITLIPEDNSIAPRAMERRHASGLFAVQFPGLKRPFRYQLEIQGASRRLRIRDPYSFEPSIGELDLHLAAEGTHENIYQILGAHLREIDSISGTSFAVWAPNALRVSVVGSFNQWDGRFHAMRKLGSGIWEIFIPGVGEGALYKFELVTKEGIRMMKSDPCAQAMQLRPDTASRVYKSKYQFNDSAWMKQRAKGDMHKKPMSIYEVHLGSWKRVPRKPGEEQMPPVQDARRWPTYRELADELVDYVADLGFTHIELLPVMEHPYDGSWGYQVSGYFAPTSRHGDPDDLRYFIDCCHQKNIGVILDWTPAHFPKDAAALGRFDGTPLYEHWDPRMGEHRQWQTYVFHYGRWEVRNFLISSALYWLSEFHADGLRVDAVASMLYLDYGASHPGEWVPNKYGGRENLDAVAFLQQLNDLIHLRMPGAIVCAEESTSWPGVTRPTYVGGLGFDFKWNMGWMHDTLDYFSMDSIFRSFHHGRITFGIMYAWSERFLLPLSHDEVVHLKKSLLSKMPGDRWKMAANLRALYAHMWAHPGKKLVFMGGELGQWSEWSEAKELEWNRLDEEDGAGLRLLIKDLNQLYQRYPAFYEMDDSPDGFRWIDPNDSWQSVLSYIRFPYAPKPPESVAPPPADEMAITAEGALDESDRIAIASAASGENSLVLPMPKIELESDKIVEESNHLNVLGVALPKAGMAEMDKEEGDVASAPLSAGSAEPPPPTNKQAQSPSDSNQSPEPSGAEGAEEKESALAHLPVVVAVGNFTPLPRFKYRVGVPRLGRYREALNTDAREYGGSGMGNLGSVEAEAIPSHGYAQSLLLTLPPLSVLYFIPETDHGA